MNNYKIIFRGKDYSFFDECLKSTEIFDETGKNIDNESFSLNITEVLVDFLDSFDAKTLNGIFLNIDDENKTSTKRRLYTKLSNDKYMFNGQIGFLRKRNYKYQNKNQLGKLEEYNLDIILRCTSRFDDKKGYFFCSMLLHNDLLFVDSLIPSDNTDVFFDYLLLFRYISLLKDAFLKGYYKKYVTFYNNNDRLKGTIDIARHIVQNSGHDNGKIAYSFRENTVKNHLNMLIVSAYQKLKKKFPDLMGSAFTRDLEDIINGLKTELGYYNCSVKELFRYNSKPIYHPYYCEYEHLRDICLKILRDEGINLNCTEETDESNGYLVYIPTLWEKFLGFYFKQFDQLLVKPQDPHEVAKSSNGKHALHIKPDFVFYDKEKKCIGMLDAKFIPAWGDASENDEFMDVTNDFNKCLRDMVCLGIHKTGVVFPYKNKELFRQYEINTNDTFYALGINVPTVEERQSFYSWNKSFEKKVKEQIENNILPVYKITK